MIYLLNYRKAFRSTSTPTDFTTSLDRFWDLDDGSGDAIADAGGLDLTDTTAVGSGGAAPDGGGTRSFGATDHFAGTTTIPSTVTFAFWAQANAVSDYLFSFSLSPFIWCNTSSSNNLQVRCGSTLNSTTGSNFALSVWHSVVVTMGGSNQKLFIDGNEEMSLTGSHPTSSGTFRIGAQVNTAGELDGEMCSFGIWSLEADANWASNWHNGGVNLRYADF